MGLVLALVLVTSVWGREQITRFHSEVTISADGSLDVVETIRVVAEGNRIKRGISRDFPTRYVGGLVVVPFEVVSVERDGKREPFHLEDRANGVRVYIGSASRMVERGEHTYVLHYRTDYQLRHGGDEDELYWNVTGNGWVFPILESSATVVLPEGLSEEDLDRVALYAYAGGYGARDQEGLTKRVDEAGRAVFTYERELRAHEGLTVSVIWPTGYVAKRSVLAQMWGSWVFWTIVGGLVVVTGYFGLAWLAIGRDPHRGVVYPRYEPPFGMGPATLRYVWKMGYDPTCFTALLMSIGAKGWMRIEKRKIGGDYVLVREGSEAEKKRLSQAESAVYKILLGSCEKLHLAQKNRYVIIGSIIKCERMLDSECLGHLFRINAGWWKWGAFLSVVLAGFVIWRVGWSSVMAWADLFGGKEFLATAWPLLLMFGIFVGMSVIRPFLARGVAGLVKWVLMVLLGVGLVMLTGWFCGLVLWWLVFLMVVFEHLLKRPTVLGRELMDMIEGFRMYLETSSRDELRALMPAGVRQEGAFPEDDLELFERYLPYAIALDLENAWAERFEDVMKKASMAHAGKYHPPYYHGSFYDLKTSGGGLIGAGGLVGIGSSLSGSIASSSVAPGSRSGGGGFSGGGGGGFSGGGGGGFSGGGGGGGGGGGW